MVSNKETWTVFGSKNSSIMHPRCLSTQPILQITMLCRLKSFPSVVEEVAAVSQLAKLLTFLPVLHALKFSLSTLNSAKQENRLPAKVAKGNPRKTTPCRLHGNPDRLQSTHLWKFLWLSKKRSLSSVVQDEVASLDPGLHWPSSPTQDHRTSFSPFSPKGN